MNDGCCKFAVLSLYEEAELHISFLRQMVPSKAELYEDKNILGHQNEVEGEAGISLFFP